MKKIESIFPILVAALLVFPIEVLAGRGGGGAVSIFNWIIPIGIVVGAGWSVLTGADQRPKKRSRRRSRKWI